MSDKAKCRYWEKCFRKDKNHLATFLHPRDTKSPAAGDAAGLQLFIWLLLMIIYFVRIKSSVDKADFHIDYFLNR